MISQECTLNLDSSRRELYPHGTAAFPCAGFASTHTERADDEVPWHWHEEMEIIYIPEGSMKVQLPGRTLCLKAGDISFINSGILHRAEAVSCCKLHSIVFSTGLLTGGNHSVFFSRYLEPLLRCPSLAGCLLTPDEDWMRQGIHCFISAFEAMSGDEFGYEFAVRGQLSSFCLLLCMQFRDQIEKEHKDRSPDKQRICQMMDYIHEHYTDTLTLSKIARSARISERECLRCFQRVIQIPPMQYLLKHRMLQAAAMLSAHPERSIADVSIRCGIDSPSNFSKQFKRFFVCTPKEYRNDIRNNAGQAHNTAGTNRYR